ncbi:CheR family methyltransferase [Oleiharenicola lentus]|uniref:CheR family methyltransferase n=1 Tax=Oleiharenicola lentus TaxID=2508720 RepID=UPI003F6650F4
MFPTFPAGRDGILQAPAPVPTLLRDLVHEKTGVHFDDSRLDSMLEKLADRARAHQCASFLDYYYILKYEEKGKSEWLRVMDAFSVPETYFWRELDQVRALVDVVVPAWFKNETAPLRIWSAACATGEEPLSLAIALQEGGWGNHPIEINASDGSEAALDKARAGIYRERSFRSMPDGLRAKYFTATAAGMKIDPQIAARVNFHWANLVAAEEFHGLANSQVIFCRNVFIYFSPAAIKRTAESFAARMPRNGYLFVGASESLLKITAKFELQEIAGAFVYVKVEPS